MTVDPNNDIRDALWAFIEKNISFRESSQGLGHYTRLSSALEILKSGTLWARDTSTFPKCHGEDHRIALTLEALSWSRQHGPTASRPLRNGLRSEFLDPTLAVRAFAACLSTDTDSPHMWREFGDSGHGCCIVVDPRFVNPDVQIFAIPCIYDLETQKEVLTGLLECADTLAAGLLQETRAQRLLIDATACLILAGQAYKVSSLVAERECRYVYLEYQGQSHNRLAEPTLGNDPGSQRVIPIVGTNTLSPFVAVRLGPSASTEKNVRGLMDHLASIGLSDLSVETSSCRAVPENQSR